MPFFQMFNLGVEGIGYVQFRAGGREGRHAVFLHVSFPLATNWSGDTSDSEGRDILRRGVAVRRRHDVEASDGKLEVMGQVMRVKRT
jgi:hypothetical protein